MRQHAAAVLIVLGAAGGTLDALDPPRRSALPDNLIAADFHVHAAPGDGALTVRRLLDEARRRELDAIAVTNHNQMLALRVAEWTLPDDGEPLLLPGIEITNPEYHLIAVGVTSVVDWRQPAAAVIDAVQAQGGIAIAAHPTAAYAGGWDDAALARLDGIEVAHPIRDERAEYGAEIDAFMARARSLNPGVAAIGSSDFHVGDQMGRYRTYLQVGERSRRGVLDAVRRGRTAAGSAAGKLVGSADVIDAVRATQAGRTGTEGGDRPQFFYAAAAWTGIALLLLSGGGRALGRSE